MLTHYSKRLIFPLFACAALLTHADVVSVDSAKQLAADFFSAGDSDQLASVDDLDHVYTCVSKSKPLYYVFNIRDHQGFVIISADDCTTPVLGYSLENSYNAASVPPAMKWMMQGLESEIIVAADLQKPVAQDERRHIVRRAARSSERILLKTPEWRQEAPFNSMIPGNPLAGCVGTAMAMIMKYHNYPEKGNGSYNGVNFDVAYDWPNMRMDNYRYGYSQAESDAVATLVYHAASSIGTQFGYSGSSAYEVKVPAALINYFGYDPGVSYKKRSETATQAEFDRLVENDIKAGRPVLYCGQDVTAGHAFVVDGYDPFSGMIHINWGWGGADGNNNGGWYASTALNPNVSQQHSFNNLTTIIYNIKPGDGYNSAWSPIHITSDSRQVGMGSDFSGDLSVGKTFTVRVGNLKNVSYNDFSGKIAVALFSADGIFKSLLSDMSGFSLAGMDVFPYTYADFKCQLPAGTDVAEGDMIRMATSADNGASWLPVAGELITTNEIAAKGAEPRYFAISHTSPLVDVTFSGESRVIPGWNYRFRVVPSYPERDVITVKANGYVLVPDANYNYTINNVIEDQDIAIYVQRAADVKEKRSLWVNEPGSLESLLSGGEAGTVKELTLFGNIDARDFAFMKSSMKLTRLDISSVKIAANGADQANAIPREAFRGLWSLKEVILPNNVTRLNNGAFRSCGISGIVIPASVNTIEYNVFNASSGLLDVWVGNPTPVYINWCVFHGAPTSKMTLHCPSEAALDSYNRKEYWKDIANKVVDPIQTSTDYAFAVMENPTVRYVCDTDPGRYGKGKKAVFTAEYIVDDDNRLDVYANSTLLRPDAQGNYTVTINDNTIIHFDIVEPIRTNQAYDSPWTITDDGGTVGMFTDAVNVLPGVPFVIRVNSFAVTDKAFWGMVLTTADGMIKEFISPIGNWSAAGGRGFKMNVNCCVTDATVKEGNMIRLATSYNKKTWTLVKGSNNNVIDAIPAINNQTPVYNFTFPDGLEQKANLSGIVANAVHGRDLTFKITPKSAGDVITMSVNGVPYAKEAKSVSYSFIAKEDLNFDVRVITPDQMEAVVFDLEPGERLWDPNNPAFNRERKAALRPKVVVRGNIDYTDFGLFRDITAHNTVVSLDLSGANIVADRNAPAAYPADEFPAEAFCSLSSITTTGIKLRDLKFPLTVKRIGASALYNCSEITELELPHDLYNDDEVYMGGKDRAHQGGLKRDCFKGCDKLSVIYCYAAPVGDNADKVHHIDFNSSSGLGNDPTYFPNDLGLADPSKVTVVVKPEHWDAYTTEHNNGYNDWINGWVYNKFNMVYDYPVYGVNFDVTRCFVKNSGLDLSKVVSFVGNNTAEQSLVFSGQVYIAAKSDAAANRPEGADAYDAKRKLKVYDNGRLIPDENIASDGSVALTFYNPNDISRKDLVGNHVVDVVYLYDVIFNCASANLVIKPEKIRNNEESDGDNATEFETFNYYNAVAPVIENVREGSAVRFKVDLSGINADEVRTVVKVGENIVSVDDEGYYHVDVDDEDVAVNVYTVPVNGATIGPDEADMIDASEAKDVTSIALAGDISAEKIKEIIDELPALEQLDLSALSVALPEGAMAGKETLETVSLPAAADIEAGTFSGCVNLANVHVPECVNTIGAEAFKDCISLGNLSFTGIKAIGANAFSGCTGLTSIIITAPRPDSQPARVHRRAASPRTEGYSADAFAGINPNCIVYLDENVELPAAKANYVRVRQDAEAIGGRVYEALGSISLDPGYDFRALNSFSVTEGNTISMEIPLSVSDGKSNWSPLVLPFSPDKVKNAAGGEMSAFSGLEVDNANGIYMVASLGDDGSDVFGLMKGIDSNTPYIVSLYDGTDPGVVRFESEACEVVQTPLEICRKGSGYDLKATLCRREVSAATACLLDDHGSSFVSAISGDNMSEVTTVYPFSVYAVSADGSRIDIDVDIETMKPGGIDGVYDGSGISVVRENGRLVIYSDCEMTTDIFGIDGMCVKTLRLFTGRNEIAGLAAGIYIVLGKKIVL